MTADRSQHPHHTWQSWRERWVKNLKDKPRPNIPEGDLELKLAEGHPPPQHSSAAAKPPARTTGVARPAQPNAERKPEAGPSTPQRSAPRPKPPTPASINRTARGRNKFTDEEDQLLLGFIERARAQNEYLSGNRIYKQFAEEVCRELPNLGFTRDVADLEEQHPSHSWHSWRDRWVRHLSLREAVDDDGPDDQSNAAPEQAGDLGPQRRRVAGDLAASSAVMEVPSTAEAVGATPRRSAASSRPNPKSDEERLRRQEEVRRRIRATKLLQRAWRGHAVRSNLVNAEAALVPLQAMMRGYVIRQREARRRAEAIAAANAFEDSRQGSVMSNGEPRPDRAERREFYEDLQAYIEVNGANVKFWPPIGGRRVDLWDLFRIATQQDCEPDERDWAQVAEGLKYDSSRSEVVTEVRNAYQQNLIDFEESIRAFDNDVGSEEDPEEVEEAGGDTAGGSLLGTSDFVTTSRQPVANPSSAAYPSSPLRAGGKRSRQHSELLSFEPGYPSSGTRKRRRLNENAEIPPTPEGMLGFTRGHRRPVPSQDLSSPLKARGLADGDAIAISSGEESDDLLDEEMVEELVDAELPSHARPPRKKYVEPETQDWRFGMNDQGLLDSVGEEDISPSQQLQLESDAFRSPNRFISSRQIAGQWKTNQPSPATGDLKATGNRGSRARPFQALNSDTAPVAGEEYGTRSSRSAVIGKAPKRTLPAQYQRKPDSVTPTLVAASDSARNAAQPKSPYPVHAPSIQAAVRPANEKASRPKPSGAYTPKPTALSSPRRAPPMSTSRPQTLPSRKDAISHEENGVDYDPDYVDAQIQHFQAMGYKGPHISQALEAATLQRGPMIQALESLAQGRGIPENEPGIWTPRDNADLRMVLKYERLTEKGKQPASTGPDGQRRSKVLAARFRLEGKHGKKGPGGFDSRAVFLQMFMQLMPRGENGGRQA